MNVKNTEIKDLMSQYKKMVVYGLSGDPMKASNSVPLYMKSKGWDIVGTYPKPHDTGFKIYTSLAEVPQEYRKFVDVFRASEKIPDVVDEILELGGVEVLWLQLGIFHPEAEERAEKAGIKVVSNRCLVIEHRKWFK
jgi:predicted CoA-binding protein